MISVGELRKALEGLPDEAMLNLDIWTDNEPAFEVVARFEVTEAYARPNEGVGVLYLKFVETKEPAPKYEDETEEEDETEGERIAPEADPGNIRYER